MKTREEIQEKIDNLNFKIESIKNLDPEEISNELKVTLAGTELQAILLTSVIDDDEEHVRALLERYEARGEKLIKDYEEASKYNQIEKKKRIHPMIWTNDTRVDTYKWVLNEEDTDI